MHTVTTPAALQDQALAIIRLRLPDATDFKTPVMAAGGEVLAHILCDLERAFSILIDVDEVWRGATVEDLVRLVRAKVANAHRRALLPANDTAPRGEGSPLRPGLQPVHLPRTALRAGGGTGVIPPPSGEGDREAVEGASAANRPPLYLPPNLPPHPQDNRAHVVRLIQNAILISLMAGGAGAMAFGALGFFR